MKEVVFGQYYPSESVIHKMNPAIKILLSIIFIVAVFLVKQFHFYGFALCLFFIFATTLVAKIPILKLIKSIKAILFMIILSLIVQLFLVKEGTPLWENGFITTGGLLKSIYVVSRITLVLFGASLLTFTTSPVELADGIECLLFPLKLIKVPVQVFALEISIALRFIPILINEADRIIKAQMARGANFESKNVIKKAKALIPVLIPLLISSLHKANELADAMDSRCYAGSINRTKYKKLSINLSDIVGIILFSALIVGVIFLNSVYGVNL